MMRFPYTPVAGQGLGVSYSSLTQLGPIVPSQQPGQANVKVFINVANGNLTVFDHTASVIEQNGQLDFRYVYNSQANPGQAWRLGVARLFKQLPSPTRPFGRTAVLQETDGHETTYTIGLNNWYFASAHGEGTPYFRYHESTGQWILFEPHSQITEYYDAQGILRKREDAAGRTTTFEYDATQQLTAVIAPNSNRYEIRRAGGDVGIYLREGDRIKLLQVHHFNSAGLLAFTELPNQYRISYKYNPNSSQLDSIEQTDGTIYTFDYENKSQQAKVEWCGIGDSGNRTQIRYDKNKVTLRAGDIVSTYITLDAQSRITNLTREGGYLGEPGGLDDTQYSYTSKGQLKGIIHPNQGIEEFEYNHVFDLLTQHTQPDGQVLAYQYGLTPDQAKVICRSVYSATAPDNTQITRYVYDTNYDGQRHSVLRFEISALGCVKEYLDHQEGNPTKVRTFLNATFDVHDMAPDIAPCLSEMTEWVAAQNKQQISLDELIYDRRGQVLQTVQYTDIDNSGAGFANDTASCERNSRDEFGLLRMRKVKLSAEQSATTIYDHDELLRATLIIDALEQRTEMTYLDSQMQVKTQRPNGRVELQQRDKQGLTDFQLEIVGSKREQQRQVSYKRDTSGRAVVTYHPDNRETFSFYDCQDRLGFIVSATGIVVEYQYDLANRCNTTIQYANAVDVTKLRYAPDFLPTVGRLLNLLTASKDLAKDRYSYQFMDKTGRPRYQVDVERYVSEFHYNALGKVSDELHYAAPLSDAQLQQLKQGQTLVLPFDPQHDRCQRSFYNLDGWLIAEQNGAGYVTEYRRDKAGRLQETIRYATPIKPDLAQTDYEAIKPAVTVKDAHHYYFRDARGQCTLEVDAEGYVTSHTYRASGLKSHSQRFANKVDPNWYQDTSKLPPFPSASDKDQTTVYHFDSLGRETGLQLPEAKLITTAYDVMGHSIYRHVKDNFLPQSTDPSLQRSEQTQFDGWEQKTEETNPFVAQRLFEIDSDSTLSTEEKNQQKAEVWQNHSIRHVYDSTGLKLKTLDPLGHTTLYYYDTERRPVLTINPRGVVTETSYNNFHEPTVIRQYKKALRADTLAALTGGFMNDLVRQLLVNLRDKVNDSVTQFEHDKRGHTIQTTGPEGHVSVQTFNAFGQCAEERLPVEGTTPSLTITHRYEGRGLEIETIKQTGAEQIAVKQAYEDVYGQQTALENEMGQRTKTLRNKLGQPQQIIDALERTVQTLTHDSFGRVIKETDALGQDTLHDYSNFDRSHTVSNPATGAKQIIQTNVFGKPLVIADGLGYKTCFAYAPDGQETRHTDALQQTTETQYDCLGQKTHVIFPNKREDTFTYDSEGNLTEVVQDAAGLALGTQHEYNSFNQQTAIVDAKGVRSEFTLDKRGLVKQTLLDPSREDYQGLGLLTVQSFNGQGKALSTLQGTLAEPNQHYVLHQHDGFNREIGENIDPVTQVHPEGLMITSGKQLNKQGKPIKLIDPNGNVTRLFYDALGQKRFKVDAEGGVMEWRYDANGKLNSEWVYNTKIDVNPLSDSSEPANVQALLKPDADDTSLYHFYDASQRECYTVNSRGTVTEKRYDAASRHVQTTVYKNSIDPKRLQDLTTRVLATLIQPDPAQDRTTYHILDAINQERYIIAPDGGITEQIFNKQGHIVAEIQYVNKVTDPASLAKLPLADIGAKLVKDPTQDRVTYHLFDSLNNPLFLIKPEGTVIGYRYDAQNQLIQECKFAKRITMPADYHTVEAEVKSWQPNRATDRIIEHERDNAGRIVKTTDALGYSDNFELDAFGQTKTHTDRRGYLWRYQYDRAKRLTKEVKPEAQITFGEHQDLAKRQLLGNSWYTDGDISALVELSLQQKSHGYAQDCHFLLDGLYADEGIAYQVVVTPAIDTQGLSTPLDFYLDKAKQPAPVVAAVDDRRDVFDEIALSLLTEQNVNLKILFPYNKSQQHWLTGEIRLHKQGHVYEIACYAHDPYGQGRMPAENARQLRETLKKRLLQLDTEAQVRFKVKTSPYAARQHQNDGDACGAIVADELVQRCLGQNLTKAESHPVGALALREQQLAQLKQHLPANDATLQQFEARHTRITHGKLALTQARIAVEKENHYDKAGNTEILIDAANTQDKRTFKSLYDRNNKLIGTVVEKVTVDDPNKTASLTERPEQTVDLTTRIVRNGKGLEVANRDEQGRWTFKIYDSENRLLYTITPGKTVVKTERNSFGETEREIYYANRLELDTRAYLDTGIPRELMENGESLTPSAADRVTRYQYNQQGKVVLKEQGPVFYYVPKADGTADYGMGLVQTRYEYNTFGEVIKTALLINSASNEWAEERKWRNRSGAVAAECDAVGQVKRYTHNPFDEVEKREEFDKRLNVLPTDATTLAELDASLAALRSVKDRSYCFGYDANGQNIMETRVGIVLQALKLDEHNKPSLEDLPAQNLTLRHEYNAVGQEIATTYEDGSQAFCYFNECGAKIAETSVARQSWDEADNPITLIPLTSYGVNSFGQPITTTRYKQGTAKADTSQVPVPIALDAEDQTETRLYDARGLMQSLQDAEGHVKSFTYTPTRKPAREYHPLTNWEQQNPTSYTLKTHVDEKRFSYDANDNAEQLLLVRDGNVMEITQTLHNSFDEPIAEGPGDGAWPLHREFDATGKIWRHNANSGSYTIQLRDGRGLETLSCQSATKALDQVEYDKLSEMLSWKIEDLERTEAIRDKTGRSISNVSPAYWQPDDTHPDNIPLSVLAGASYPDLGKTSLSWTHPQETNVEPEFALWPQGQPGLKHVLEIKNSGNRCGVNVSAYASDVYEYEINYFMRNPVTGALENKPLYRTAGAIQVDTGNNENSYNLVAMVDKDHQLVLTGHIQGLIPDAQGHISVELWQDEQKLADLLVAHDPKAQRLTADLSAYLSGSYQIKTQLIQQSENWGLTARPFTSLPFIIYTPIPAKQPLAREIPAVAKLLTLATHGQLIWQVPESYAKLPVKVRCIYADTRGHLLVHEDIIRYDTDKGHYQDSKGDMLYCNLEFAHAIKEIKTLSLALVLNENDLLPLYNNFAPTQATQMHQTLRAGQLGADDLIITALFTPRTMLYLMGVPGKTEQSVLEFWDTSRDRLAEWKSITSSGLTTAGVIFDVSGMQPGCYPFKLEAIQGQFTVAEGGYVLASRALPEPKPKLVRPIRQTEYDNWDNPIKKVDTLGNETLMDYNIFNQVVKLTQPVVNVVAEDGTVSRQAPVTVYGYNARGKFIGVRDANLHTRGYVLDNAGNMVKEILPDGMVAKTQVLDALNRCIRWKDARGKSWRQQFDRLNQITSTTTPLNRQSRYIYNEMARTSDIDPAGNQTRYNISVRGDIEIRFLPLGQATVIEHDRNHQPIKQTNGDGILTWERDYFGNAKSHTDLNHALYVYEHDKKAQLIRESSSGGNEQYNYINLKKTRDITEIKNEHTPDSKPIYIETDFYQPFRLPVPSQDLQHVYQAGRLVEVHDKAHNKSSYYTLDSENRRTSATVKEQGEMIRNVQTRIDALGREEWTFDTMMQLVTGYDTVSNRRHIKSILYPGNGLGPITQESWNKFNENDYIIIDGGVLKDGQIQVVPGQGMQLTYQNGLRQTETRWYAPWSRFLTTTLGYDDDGKLTTTQGSEIGRTERVYTKEGYLEGYYEHDLLQNHIVHRNANSWIIHDRSWHDTGDGIDMANTYFDTLTASGQPIKQRTLYYRPSGTWDEMYNSYRKRDGLLHAGIGGWRHNDHGTSPYSNSELLYDANGMLNAVLGADASQLPEPIRFLIQPIAIMVTTHNGLILRKCYLPRTWIFSDEVEWKRTNYIIENYYFYTVNDQYMTSYAIESDPVRGGGLLGAIVDYIKYGQGWTGSRSQEMGIITQRDRYGQVKSDYLVKQLPGGDGSKGSTRYSLVDPLSYAFCRLKLANYIQAVSKSFPASGVTEYIVKVGDTFESISLQCYGSPDYAVLIIAANGLTAAQAPTLGIRLTIPQMIPMTNKAGNYRAYDEFVSIIIGSLYPHLETPQPEHHGGFWEELISVVVAVVVVCVAPELLSAALPTLFAQGALQTVIASAIISSAVAQGVAIGLGIQDHFSWQALGTAALTAGFTHGLTPHLNIVKGEIVKNMLKYGAVSVSEQLAEMAVGLRPKFDFRLVASAMAAQTLNGELGLNEAHTPLESASQTTVNSAVASIAYGHTPDIEMLAAQALGTMIGYSAGNPLAATLRNARYANDAEFRHSEQAKVQQRLQQASQGQSTHPSSRDNQRPVQQAQQQAKPTKRSSTLFNQELALASSASSELPSSDKMFSIDALLERHKLDSIEQNSISTRAKRWQSEQSKVQQKYWEKKEVSERPIWRVLDKINEVGFKVTAGIDRLANLDPLNKTMVVVNGLFTLFGGEMAELGGMAVYRLARGAGQMYQAYDGLFPAQVQKVNSVGSKSAWQSLEEAVQSMGEAQHQNFKRFFDKIPRNSENVRVRDLPGGGKVFQADSPAKNIPGSFAQYEKQIDVTGETVLHTKTTFGPNGQIIDVAPKFPHGPKIYPELSLPAKPSFTP